MRIGEVAKLIDSYLEEFDGVKHHAKIEFMGIFQTVKVESFAGGEILTLYLVRDGKKRYVASLENFNGEEFVSALWTMDFHQNA